MGKSSLNYTYSVTESKLAFTPQESYLGVIIDSTVKASACYSEAFKKVNKMLCIIRKGERIKEKHYYAIL